MYLQPGETTLAKRQKSIIMFGIALVIILPVALSRLLLLARMDDLTLLITSRFVYWSAAGLLCLYAIKVERRPFILWHEDKPVAFYAKWAIVLYLLAIASGIIANTPTFFGWHDRMEIMTKWVNIAASKYWLLLFCSITAGITEELICRAYLLTRLQLLFKNNYMPVLISAVIFSALHYRYFSLKETIFTFLIGVIFAVHYQKYRNIHVLILTHFMIDFLSFLLARYALTHHVGKPGGMIF